MRSPLPRGLLGPMDNVPKAAPLEPPALRRVLGPFSLIALGIGSVIGTGIFVLTGHAAAAHAGPAIVASMALAAFAAALAALCYAEFASSVPVAGSAYAYAKMSLGPLVAWIIGWDLILEYALSCATVAAPNRYSRIRSQPMIHATSSPSVAYP